MERGALGGREKMERLAEDYDWLVCALNSEFGEKPGGRLKNRYVCYNSSQTLNLGPLSGEQSDARRCGVKQVLNCFT